MRSTILMLIATLSFACQSRPSEQTSSQAVTGETTSPDTLCFRQILSRDTTTLQLVRNGDQVTGFLDINPYEKDRARGTFSGAVKGDTIATDWQRSGEGTTQPYTLDLTLKGDSISWYEGERIEQAGKWQLKEPGTGYRYVLGKTDCPSPQ